MKGKALRKHNLHEKTADNVFLFKEHFLNKDLTVIKQFLFVCIQYINLLLNNKCNVLYILISIARFSTCDMSTVRSYGPHSRFHPDRMM